MPRQHYANDLTAIYYSSSKMPERWVNFQLEHLHKALGDAPIISITRKPLALGMNLPQEGTPGYWNIYMTILRGAKLATTPFVATAEDDVLYTPEHFWTFRPPMDTMSYDRSRWSLFTWDPNPIYCLRQRLNNSTMIGPRELVIEALTEWATKYPGGRPDTLVGEIGRPIVERNLRVTHRNLVEWYCTNPVIQLNHPTGSDIGNSRRADGRKMVKHHGQITAVEIPYWGKAADIVKIYEGKA
jgi:hypothetical protein